MKYSGLSGEISSALNRCSNLKNYHILKLGSVFYRIFVKLLKD